MAFVVGVVGVAVVGRVLWDDHSNYRDYTRHNQYGDSQIRSEISSRENSVKSKENEVEDLRRRVDENFKNRIAELKRQKNYPALDNSSPQNIVDAVAADMRREIEAEIQRDRQELAEIDRMISRINELELQAKGT